MAALVRLYHDQTWLLILGAGATKTAGLERITAKHLAIASQAIALVGTLVPQFSQLAESVLAGTAAPVRSFKELEQVYANHREELLEKLIAIMNDRTRALAHQLSQLDLEAEPSPGQANSYMVTLVKDTTILFKVLSKFLNGASLQRIMSDVVAFAEAHLAEIFASKTSAGSVKAEQAIKADRAYYLSKIGALPGILALLQPPLGSKLGPLEASVQTPGEEVSMTFDEISPMKANEIAAVDAVATAEATKETKVEQGPA
jgi:vacuolar protein sorting-associated protein 54